jgi:hypothetical protein
VSEALAGKYADYVELHGDDDPHLRDRYLQLCEVWALGMLDAKRAMADGCAAGRSSAVVVNDVIITTPRRDPVCRAVLWDCLPAWRDSRDPLAHGRHQGLAPFALCVFAARALGTIPLAAPAEACGAPGAHLPCTA